MRISMTLLVLLAASALLCLLHPRYSGGRKVATTVVVPHLIGGIGNQLYVAMTAYALALATGRKFALAWVKEAPSFGAPRPVYFETLFRNFHASPISRDFGEWATLSDDASLERVSNLNTSNIYLDGYFQSSSLIFQYQQEIKDIIYLPPSPETHPHDIAFHVRLQDERTLEGMGCILDSWMIPAVLAYINRVKAGGHSKVRIFSNNVSKARKLLPSHPMEFVFVEMSSEVEELAFLGNHSNIIASASTYAFWACFLSNKVERVALAWDSTDQDEYRRQVASQFKSLPGVEVTCITDHLRKVSKKTCFY